MSDQDTQGRPEPPVAGDETATLLGSLDRQRAIFAWKCGGLDAAGLSATLGPSSMTLGGLLKHLALVEDEYFSHRLPWREQMPPWDTVERSPGYRSRDAAPGTGMTRTVSGLPLSATDSTATSRNTPASSASEMSPGSGIVSRPVPQTAEYSRSS